MTYKRNIPSALKLIVSMFFLSILPVLGYADQVVDKDKTVAEGRSQTE